MLPTRSSPAVAALVSLPALAETASVPGVSTANFVQGLIGLVFVIALLIFAAWMMKRLGSAAAFGNTAGMRIVSGLAVGPRERILLLEVGETWVIVGVTAGQMRTLNTMPRGELPDTDGNAGGAPFASWLQRFTDRQKNAP